MEKIHYICPVCGYDRLLEEPYEDGIYASYEICDCCGTEFGHRDQYLSWFEMRKEWIKKGCILFNPSSFDMPTDWVAVVHQLGNLQKVNYSGLRGYVYEQGLAGYFVCPVCGYSKLHLPPVGSASDRYINTCRCCGTTFGEDNSSEHGLSWLKLRENWVDGGAIFHRQEVKPPRMGNVHGAIAT